MAKLNVALVTPERQVARVQVDMVTAPSVQGQIGVLPDHRPLLADLEAGPVILQAGNKKEVYAVSGGFIEVDKNNVVVLAEAAEHTSEIDVERARAALSDAEARTKKLDVSSSDYEEQRARAQRARVRLAVLQK